MTPVFCCGFECGILSDAITHWIISGTVAIDTTIKRSGARSLRINPTAGNARAVHTYLSGEGPVNVIRFYVYFASLPTGNCVIASFDNTVFPGVMFKQSDSKLYAGKGAATAGAIVFGATGVTVTTGIWYRIDVKIDSTSNPWTVDVQVDGTACGQATIATAAVDKLCDPWLGNQSGTAAATYDAYFDDYIQSRTSADYPIGAGYVNHFVPTADGTHNIAGLADFRRGAAGADITNSNTNSYDLVDDVPMDDTTPDTNDFINCLNPPNATDYTENVFGPAPGISTPTVGPRAVEVAVATHQSGTGIGVSVLKLNDNGTEDTIWSLAGAGVTTIQYQRKHYATMVGGGSWTVERFNNLRIRFGYSSDANPDQYFDCAMIEAEFAPAVEKLAPPPQIISQSLKRAAFY